MDLSKFTNFKYPTGGILYSVSKVSTPNFNYSMPLGIYFPPGLTQPKRMVMYVHGWRGVCEPSDFPVKSMMERFDLVGQLDRSAPDAVLVFPQSRGHCDTFNQELVPRFSKFLGFLEDFAKLPTVFSGHSGAYLPMGQMVMNLDFSSRLQSTIFLDALYSSNVTNWVKAGKRIPTMKFATISLRGGGTESGSHALKVQTINPVTVELTSLSHCKIPNNFLGKYLKLLA